MFFFIMCVSKSYIFLVEPGIYTCTSLEEHHWWFFFQFLIIVNIVTSLGLITCETFWPGGRFSTGDHILHHQVFSVRVLQPMKQQMWCVVDLSHDICVILIKHSLRHLIVRVLTQHYICLHSMCLAVQQLYNACVSKKANLQQG